jgi:hypothetical protein
MSGEPGDVEGTEALADEALEEELDQEEELEEELESEIPIEGGGNEKKPEMYEAWFHPLPTVIYRVVPIEGKGSVCGIRSAGITGVIHFGKEKVSFPSKGAAKFTDPYRSSKITDESTGIDIIEEQASVAHLFNYSIDSPVNVQPGLSLWPIYRIWHLKQLLSAYIGCPTSHISLRDKLGNALDVYASSEAAEMRRVPTELLQSVKDLPKEVYLLLVGDWLNRKDVELGPGESRYSTGDLVSKTASLESIRKSERVRIMSIYAVREKILSDIISRVKPGKEPSLHGNVTQTELSAYPSEKGSHIVDNERMFGLLRLNQFRPKDMSVPDWLTVLSYNNGSKIQAKILRASTGVPDRIAPSRSGALGALLLVREKETPVHLHAFMVTLHDDFRVNIVSNWAGNDVDTRESLKGRSEKALNAFLRRMYSFFEEDIMRPDSSLPNRRTLRKTLSIVAYRENYVGGNFEKYKEAIAQLARAELARITYLTSSSIYFQLPQGWSEERLSDLYLYLSSRPSPTWNGFSDTNGFNGTHSEDQDGRYEAVNYVAKGPEIQLKAEATELFIMISGCNGDEEITLAGKLAGVVAVASGYVPSTQRGTKMMRDYANLSLLEQIDPILFGSRLLPGGERVNYSRECQGASRHPIPISIDEALAHPSSRIEILTNTTYGGPQAYKAPTDEFPVISFRAVPFQNYCVVCCVQKPVDPSSLRWDEYSECARHMMFDQSKLATNGRRDQVYGSSLQFDGNRIVRGRIANFPKGVREHFPPTAFLYSPIDVDSSNLHDVIEWTVGYPIEEMETGNPYDQMMNYAIRGVPVAFLRLTPSSKKVWRASLLELSEFYDVPPYVICMWTSDTSADQFPASYHPIVSEDRKPLTSDDLRLEIEYGGREATGQKAERAFTIEILGTRLPNYRIVNTVMSDDYCYAVTLARRTAMAHSVAKGKRSAVAKGKTSSRSTAKGKARSAVEGKASTTGFLIPIRPTRTKSINPISIQEATLPTVKQLDELLSDIKKEFQYSLLSARSLIYDEKDMLLSVVISPDGVVVHVQPSSVPPKELDLSMARRQTIARHAYEMVWDRIKLYPSTPAIVDFPFTVTSLRSAEMYLAAKAVRYGVVSKLVEAAKKKLVVGPTHSSEGKSSSSTSTKAVRTATRTAKDEDPRDAFIGILSTECKKFVRLGKETKIALSRNNIILFSERAEMPKELFDSAITRLAAYCPKNPQLILPYFKCFGSVLHPEKPSLEEWEKIVS